MIDDEQVIKLLSEDYKNNKDQIFTIEDYDFNGLNINIDIYKHPNWDTFILKLYIVDYLSKQNNFGLMFLNSLENKTEFKNIEDVISFLLLYFRNNYIYSKILDEIHCKDSIKNKENLKLSYFKLSKNKEAFDICCVCLESNYVKTKCDHNVCRPCYTNLKILNIKDEYYDDIECKICPLCRGSI